MARHTTPGGEQSVEFVAAVCDDPSAVRGNFEADIKPLAGVDPAALAKPWFTENGPAVSGQLPAGCTSAGAGFVLEVARDTRHITAKVGLTTGADGRAVATLESLPHSDRLRDGNEIWARPVNPDPNQYRPVAFRCGRDARNGDLTEYISGAEPNMQHCVAYFVPASNSVANAAPTSTATPPVATAPITTGATSTPAVTSPTTTAAPERPSTTTAPPVASATTTTTATTTTAAPTATTAPRASVPATDVPVTENAPTASRPTTNNPSAGSAAANTNPSTAPAPSTPAVVSPGGDSTSAGSTDASEGAPSATGSAEDTTSSSADEGSSQTGTASGPSVDSSAAAPVAGDSAGTATAADRVGSGATPGVDATAPRITGVPVTRPEPTPIDESAGASGITGDAGTTLSRPEQDAGATPATGDEGTTGDTASGSETALGNIGPRGVDLILAIKVQGVTQPGGEADASPWTEEVRAEVRCGDGPPKILTLTPGEVPGFRLTLGMNLPVTETTTCTHSLLRDGLDNRSQGGVVASVDGKATRRGVEQTVLLNPEDGTRTLDYELIFVDAAEASERAAAGDEVSLGDSTSDDELGIGSNDDDDNGLAATGERIPAPTLVALGVMFVVGLALSIAQSSKAT